MQENEMRHVAIRVVLEEPGSGLLRFVGDVQRFGFRLNTLVLAREKDGASIVTAALSVPSNCDVSFITTRFARHPDITNVVVGPDIGVAENIDGPGFLNRNDVALDHTPCSGDLISCKGSLR
jgi:hypothetical protein